jgi:hypothetical protein
MTMTHMLRIAATYLIILTACGGTSRGLEAYRADTQKLLETRNVALKSCYDDALRSNAKLTGTVTIRFVVEKQTGAIRSASVDGAGTSAPNVLGECVLQAMNGLKLEPADRNEGQATFVYEFKPAAT